MQNPKSSINYPFQGRNFFEEPENYFYSDCSSISYLENFIEYRLDKIKELSLSTHNDVNDEFFKHYCKTDAFLREIMALVRKGDTTNLDKFCVKFEKHKKFYAIYDKSTFLPKSKKVKASFSAYVTFSECLCIAFEITENLKYLSTLLKVNDAICSLKIPFKFADRVKKLIKSELNYVKQL